MREAPFHRIRRFRQTITERKFLFIDQYFTNREDAKMYDLEIDVYNYIVDDSHPAEGQIYIKTTKTGAATDRVTDVMTTAKDPELVAQIKR